MRPKDIPIVDTMIGLPHRDLRAAYARINGQLIDSARSSSGFPADYLFPGRPEIELEAGESPADYTLREMDRWGVERGLIDVDEEDGEGGEAAMRHPDRFIPSAEFDARDGMAGIAKLVDQYEKFGIRAISVVPMGSQVAINSKRMYPLYAKACELKIPVFCTAGVPGPRMKTKPQRVDLIDEVMHDFPDLVFVTRHGCEPWTDMAVKLMIKWPNLYFSTSGFAPKYYSRDIIDYANTRGTDKVIYAGYFPFGLSMERLVTELDTVGFRDHVWRPFLRDNALRVLGVSA